MVKYIAFHLPQFHTFPENDEWWGKGFTEWTNVRAGKPLYRGHHQPRIPSEDIGYYNLMDYGTRKRQAEQAQKYGLHGFCYYHYWFAGKLLMEKPLEALLQEKDITLPFCFCWANEPWTRAWDGAAAEVIMPQNYGDRDDWKAHIDYLLPFFQDDRYIKINNAPMFVIYRTNNIPQIDEMIEFWDEYCRENGFSGIHLVEEFNTFQSEPACKKSKAVLEFEPLNIQRNLSGFGKGMAYLRGKLRARSLKQSFKLFDYRRMAKKICDLPIPDVHREVYLGTFPGWDNSPRRKKKAVVFEHSSPENFRKHMHQMKEKAENNQIEYIFINAWNEWAEGAYLEPDQRNGYQYLEVVKECAR